MNNTPLDTPIHVFQKTHDPRKPRGIRHDYHGTLVLVFIVNWGIRFAPPNFSLFLWVSSGIRGAGHFP